jgi:hypothetical protein
VALTYEQMLHAAHLYGYDGPDTPEAEPEVLALAEALQHAAAAVGSPGPHEGTGPRAYIARVMSGEIPVPLGGVG